MAENYYLLFKPLPVGDHMIELEVIRQPLQAIIITHRTFRN
jgi:hypothetical protein